MNELIHYNSDFELQISHNKYLERPCGRPFTLLFGHSMYNELVIAEH
jgi:hypothetical protein